MFENEIQVQNYAQMCEITKSLLDAGNSILVEIKPISPKENTYIIFYNSKNTY